MFGIYCAGGREPNCIDVKQEVISPSDWKLASCQHFTIHMLTWTIRISLLNCRKSWRAQRQPGLRKLFASVLTWKAVGERSNWRRNIQMFSRLLGGIRRMRWKRQMICGRRCESWQGVRKLLRWAKRGWTTIAFPAWP